MSMENDWVEVRMQESLRQRREKGTLRRLPAEGRAENFTFDDNKTPPTIDFSSNDYLGLAQSEAQAKRVEELFAIERQAHSPRLGATGSRLLSGDSPAFHRLETYLAHF